MSANINHNGFFLARLGCFKSAWKRGLAFALLLRVAGWAVVAATAYFAADYFLALDETVRLWLNVALPVGLVACAVPEALRLLRLGLGETAERADRIGKHRRNEVLTAWELLGARRPARAEDEAGALPSFLVQRSVGEAMARLEALDPRAMRPSALSARRGRLLGIQVVAALSVALLCGMEALRIVVPRMLWPGRDIPPYSHCRFDVTPEAPSILYGGSAEVSVTLRGAPTGAQVWMMTRRSGQKKVQRAACFQDGGGRYAQRLENVTVPVQFCFAVGRARSRWHTADLQLQPQVMLTRVRLAPPPYTRLPVREFPAGQEEVAGVRGTKVTLTLTSNRPLKDGSLVIERRRAAKGSGQVIGGRLVSERSAAFEWTLQEDADAKATLRDVRGTPLAEPLVLQQKLLPDEAPKTLLAEPPEFSMATPSAVIKVVGHVEDDFGIEQLDWVRAVVGFNDRAVTLKRGAEGTRSEFEMDVNLGKLGAQAGQVLEFYAEALDNNPYLPGVGASSIVRVKVISEEEYAEMLRNRETLEQFSARYEAAAKTVKQIIAWLEELRGALAKNPERDTLNAAVKKLVTAHIAAETLFQQLARDFAVYDSEEALRHTSGSIFGKLGENRMELEDLMREPGPDNVAKVEGMIKRLKGDAESLEQQGISAELAAQVAKVMDGAARFQAVVRRQEELARRLKQRYGEKVAAADLPFLPGYGDDQGTIARELATFATDVTAAAEALPKEMEKLKGDTLSFLQGLERTGASNHMGQAVSASRNTDAPRTYREAQLALEKLQSLLRPDSANGANSFAGMCRGQQPDFGPENMKKTLREMFRSLCRKRGVGQGSGLGRGLGGEGGEGSGLGEEGYSELATPVYGPGRSQMGRSGEGEGRGKAGEGQGAGAGEAGRHSAVVERVPGTDSLAPSGEAVQFERLPVKYRDAVKRYFQGGAEGGGQ